MSAEHIPYSNAPISPKAGKLLSQYLFENETILWSGKPGFICVAKHYLILLSIPVFLAMLMLRIKTVMSGVPVNSFIINVSFLLLAILNLYLACWITPLVRYICNAMIITDRRVFCIVPKGFSSLGLSIYEANELADRTVTRHPSGHGRIDIPGYGLKNRCLSSWWTMANIDLAEHFISQIVSHSNIDDNADIPRTVAACHNSSEIDTDSKTDILTARTKCLLDDNEIIRWAGHPQKDRTALMSPFVLLRMFIIVVLIPGVVLWQIYINHLINNHVLLALGYCAFMYLGIILLFVAQKYRTLVVYAVTSRNCIVAKSHRRKTVKQVSIPANRIDRINSSQTPNHLMNVLIKSTGNDNSLVFHNLKDYLEAENSAHNLSLQAADVTKSCSDELNTLIEKGHAIEAEIPAEENKALLNQIENDETILWLGKPSVSRTRILCLLSTLPLVGIMLLCLRQAIIDTEASILLISAGFIFVSLLLGVMAHGFVTTTKNKRFLITNKRFLIMTNIINKKPEIIVRKANEIHMLSYSPLSRQKLLYF